MADTIMREDSAKSVEDTGIQTGIIVTARSKEERIARVMALMDEWLTDESGYDEETWPELKAALDRDRLSDRKLFHE